MKLLHRIIAAPLLAVGCLLVASGFAAYSVKSIATKFETLRDQKLSAARTLAEVEARTANVNALLYRTISIIESIDADAIASVRQRIGNDTRSAVADLKQITGRVDESVRPDLDAVVADLDRYQSRALQALTMAEASPGAAVAILASAETSFKSSVQELHKVSESVNADVDALSGGVVSLADRALGLLFGLSVAAAALSLGVAGWMARRMVRELAHAVTISEAVAAGQLDVVVPEGGADEIGRLLASLRHTVQRLGDSLVRIQGATGSIHTASSEIAAGSQDLSVRTEQTASNLQQTVGSVTLLSQAVDHGAMVAREASALAESASEVATRGGRLVEEVVATMGGIDASSREIGSIIGTIDGIAFQTNILALNAAVEAARAGEQGRGFAVVASEVRTLAQRSAEAAKQVKALIGVSSERTEVGSRLVGEAGNTMVEIVTAVDKVKQMISAIAARADEQNTGIAGVNRTLSGLDQMTQQNAALVEQSAAAAESLKHQAASLTEVVSTFRFRA